MAAVIPQRQRRAHLHRKGQGRQLKDGIKAQHAVEAKPAAGRMQIHPGAELYGVRRDRQIGLAT